MRGKRYCSDKENATSAYAARKTHTRTHDGLLGLPCLDVVVIHLEDKMIQCNRNGRIRVLRLICTID